MPLNPRSISAVIVASLLAAPALPLPISAQDTSSAQVVQAVDPREVAIRAQAEFELYRRQHLPAYRGRAPSMATCPEPVGMTYCYWYSEEDNMPDPLPEAIAARTKLLATLDSLGKVSPGDNWISGQRVRYLIEAEKFTEALEVAKSCTTVGWWCDALKGLALHELGRYKEAEATFEKVLADLPARGRCEWKDLTPFLDDDTRRVYSRSTCGTPEREAWEARAWWFSRTRYGMEGNDSRTEIFARLTMIEIVGGSVGPHQEEFDEAARETTLRFGWERSWARDVSARYNERRDPRVVSVIGSEAVPAHRLIPPSHVITSPASSDSIDWAVQHPPVIGRYHPKYASRLLMLEHQESLFRRGDTALLVVAYDVRGERGVDSTLLDSARLDAALVVTPGGTPRGTITRIPNAKPFGVMTVRAPWGPLLMSAEVAADSVSTLVRARYGIRPPYAMGARVSLSDLLFYAPYGSFPATVEEAMPHAFATQRIRASQKLGVYWEAYNTNPEGEQMKITLVVAPEAGEQRGSRIGRALRLSRESEPVTITVDDMSARGVRTSQRAVEVDISTLKVGAYLVQLEIDVAGQYTIRADRRLVVTGP